jgi:hypothetical protein
MHAIDKHEKKYFIVVKAFKVKGLGKLLFLCHVNSM